MVLAAPVFTLVQIRWDENPDYGMVACQLFKVKVPSLPLLRNWFANQGDTYLDLTRV